MQVAAVLDAALDQVFEGDAGAETGEEVPTVPEEPGSELTGSPK